MEQKPASRKWLLLAAKWLVVFVAVGVAIHQMWKVPMGREYGLQLMSYAGSVSVPWLRAAMDDEENSVRMTAGVALQRLGSSAVPSLRRSLKSGDAIERSAAIRAIDLIGAAGKPAAPELIECVKDANAETRAHALSAICFVGTDLVDATPAILIGLTDPDYEVLNQSLETAWRLKAKDPRITAEIIKLLKDKFASVRANAAEALSHSGTSTPEVIAALEEALSDTNDDVLEEVRDALGVLKRPAATEEKK